MENSKEYFYVTIDKSALYNLSIVWMGVQNNSTARLAKGANANIQRNAQTSWTVDVSKNMHTF